MLRHASCTLLLYTILKLAILHTFPLVNIAKL